MTKLQHQVTPTSAPARVLQVTGGTGRGGAETMLMNIYRQLDHSKIQFDFVSYSPPNSATDYSSEILRRGGRVFQCSARSPIRRMVWLGRLLRSHPEIQVVHSHTLFNTGLALLVARCAGVPVRVAHSHNTRDPSDLSSLRKLTSRRIYRSLSRYLIHRHSTCRVACSKSAGEYLYGASSSFTIVRNAIDLDSFLAAGETPKPVHRESVLRILQVGRLEPVKNHEFSLLVARALSDSHAAYHLTFAGSGSLAGSLHARALDLNVAQHITFTGETNDVPSLMRDHDVLIMPSLHEGLPLVLIEAQAAGLPAVVSSSVDRTADAGLGLVSFVPLSTGAGKWVYEVQRAREVRRPSASKRRRQLASHGYDVSTNVARLMLLYERV